MTNKSNMKPLSITISRKTTMTALLRAIRLLSPVSDRSAGSLMSSFFMVGAKLLLPWEKFISLAHSSSMETTSTATLHSALFRLKMFSSFPLLTSPKIRIFLLNPSTIPIDSMSAESIISEETEPKDHDS